MNTITRTIMCFLILVCMSLSARAQCPSPASNLVADAGVCSIRLTWTPSIPRTLVQRVMRGTSDQLSNASVIDTVLASVGEYLDTTTVRDTQYFYWIVSVPSAVCPNTIASSPVSSNRSSTSVAPASLTVTCTGVTITAQPYFDAAVYRFYRADSTLQNIVLLGESESGVYIDTSAPARTSVYYGAIPASACGSIPIAQVAPVNTLGPISARFLSAGTVVDPGVSSSITCSHNAGFGATFTWFKDGQLIAPNDPRFTGANTGTLRLTPVTADSAGFYRVQVSDTCSTISSESFILSVRPGCRADFDQNGSIAAADIFTFLNTWFAGCP